jgi:aspartate/methionine/tyrosine aminotransferase
VSTRPHQSLQEFFDSPPTMAAKFKLSASAAEPLTQGELCAFEPGAAEVLAGVTLTYPTRHGTGDLRETIAKRYPGASAEGVLLSSGVDEALGMLFLSLVNPGDRVVVLTPCYPPHLALPAWRGAEVVPWAGRPERDLVPDLDELRDLLTTETRMVVTTFPQNPTGFMPDAAYLTEFLEILSSRGVLLLSDEIYAGLPAGASVPNLACRYDKAISLHGLSKTLGLPGLRVGWAVARDPELLRPVEAVRTLFNAYLPASIEAMTRIAFKHEDKILARNTAIVDTSKQAAAEFFARHGNLFDYKTPKAGVLTFPRWLGEGGTRAMSDRMLEEASLSFAPSSCFDAGDDHFRLGLARRSVPKALNQLDEYLSR